MIRAGLIILGLAVAAGATSSSKKSTDPLASKDLQRLLVPATMLPDGGMVEMLPDGGLGEPVQGFGNAGSRRRSK